MMKILDSDGGVVIKNVLTEDQVTNINRELDDHFELANLAVDDDLDPSRSAFLGGFTKRVQHTVAKSPTYCNEFLGSPIVQSYAKALLKESAFEIVVMATQAIEMLPGEEAQVLHRDQDYPCFDRFGHNAPVVLVNMMLALTDFTEENGATRVILGSHAWNNFPYCGTPEMTIAAEMKAGDMFFFSGHLVHGGGANRTDQVRRSIATGFMPSYFCFGSEEAHPFALSVDQVRKMPETVQKMVGFRSLLVREFGRVKRWRVDMKDVEDHLGL